MFFKPNGTGSTGWAACPTEIGESRVYQVFAVGLPGVGECAGGLGMDIELVKTKGPGAFGIEGS